MRPTVCVLAALCATVSAEQRQVVWGVLGTGNAAKEFATSIHARPGTRLKGVIGLEAEDLPEIELASHPEDLASDPEIDVIYIDASSCENSEIVDFCLRSGRGVLYEKKRACSELHKLFFLYGVWMQRYPTALKLRRILLKDYSDDIEEIPDVIEEANHFIRTGVIESSMLSIGAALELLREVDDTKPLLDDTNEDIASKAAETVLQTEEHVSSPNFNSPRSRDLQVCLSELQSSALGVAFGFGLKIVQGQLFRSLRLWITRGSELRKLRQLRQIRQNAET